MHIPDGFINGGTSLGGGVVAAGGLTYTARRASVALQDKQIPLAGLTAAFIFAMQMINIPVANGTSGHLIGGTLAAVLVGPWAGAICMAVVLVAQSLFFADGGITAIGLNVTNMALLGAPVGYASFVAARRLLGRELWAVPVAAGAGGFCGTLVAVLGFVAFYAAGGTSNVPIATVAGAMIGVHVVIAILEGFLTGAFVGAVLAARPDLVFGARDLVQPEPVDGHAGSG